MVKPSIALLLILLLPSSSYAFEKLQPWADKNYSKETAKLISFRTSYRGHIWPKKDHDFYRIQVPSAGLLRIRHAGLASNVASAIKVHKVKGTQQRWINGQPGKDHNVSCPIKFQDTYWIEVADSKDTNYSKKPYTLEVDFQPVIDGNEPNDSEDEAIPIKLPITLNGFLFPQRDCDQFRFHIPTPGCLRLILTGIEPKAGSKIMVLGESGKKVTGEGSTLRQPRAGGWVLERKVGYQKLLININEPGIHTLLLKHIKSFVSLLPYRLRVEFYSKSIDTYEPNDSVQAATRIYPGEKIRAYILPAQDRDFYRIYLRGHGRLIVRQHSLRGGLGSAINIADPTNQVSLCGGWRNAKRGATEQTVKVDIDGWGDYLIQVGDPFSQMSSVDHYELQVFFLSRHKGAPWIPSIQGVPIRKQ